MMEKGQLPSVYGDVVIIGAGFSGVNMACQLQRNLGTQNFVIYDRAEELGGAWAANKYPGCGVDIPGALYSLSWFPNPGFKSVFPSQSEILSYIKRVANAYKVEKHIVLQTEWTGAKWIDGRHVWHVYLRDIRTGVTYTHEAKILISAVGGYTNPKAPSLPGAESFQGEIVHTAQWSREHDLRGRDVVIIGNGCSASQVVPAIIDEVKSLTQFMRAPQHYVPMTISNYKINLWFRALFNWVPILLLWIRWVLFWVFESGLTQFYDDADGVKMREQSVTRSRNHVIKNAPSRYQALLTPDYDLGCRRRILDNNYIGSLYNDRMHLTNDSVVRVNSKSITTTSGQDVNADFIILATGFQFSQWQGDNICGRNGISLSQHWSRLGGKGAYKSVAVHQFPNFFYILGPNSGSGHTSVLFAAECTAKLILKVIKPVLQRRKTCVEVAWSAELGWCIAAQEALAKTVLIKTCSSQHVEDGKDWNFFAYPYSSFTMWKETTFPDMHHWIYEHSIDKA